MGVHPRTKAKSQSLPRMLPPDSLQYVDVVAPSGQEPHRRVNGHPPSPHDFYRATPRRPENGRPASANQLSMTAKARFTRPPRPPSYEVHQQIRGSCEVLSGRDSVLSHARDRTPLPLTRPGDPPLDYFAQDSGPPGYIPPPSYKRAPIMRGGRRGYGDIFVDYRYRGDVYQQMQMAPDGSHWFSRHPAGSWPDPQRERSTPVQRQLYPVYTGQEHAGGAVQYIPFDDPRVRHISSALGGNSLTDADKIRHIRNELPGVGASEPGPDDSAFLPPPPGPFVAAKPKQGSCQTSSHTLDNDNSRWHSDLHKETVDNFPATDQNCNNRYPKSHRPPPSPSAVFQVSALTACSSRQGSGSEHAFTETITQVKKIVPESGPEANRNSKRRVSETIFCLVSVPIHTPANMNKDTAADQNNNETIPRLTITNTDSVTVRHSENHNMRSRSVNEMPIRAHHSHFHTSSTSSLRNYKRAPLRKEIIDAWALQANEDKELCYAGSWPGNQYRNQETQTTSPPTVMKSPDPQRSPPNGQPPRRVSSDAPAESNAGVDSSASYGYPMAGQKDLQLSSNSAFSRLSLTLGQPPSPPPPPPSQAAPASPSKERKEQGPQQPTSPKKSGSLPPDAAEQVAFGQFLLKPVDRRPWDAIGELECINKELEITISKRPHVERCSVSLDDVHDHTTAHTKSDPPQSLRTTQSQLPTSRSGRESISLPLMQGNKPNGVRIRSESCGPTTDPDFREARSASRPPSNRNHTHAHPTPPRPLQADSNLAYRQDIPVPQESLLRDVGLTVYTETPGGPGEPTHRSLSSPSPLHQHDFGQPAQPAQESRMTLVQNSSISKHNSKTELRANEEMERKAKENLPPQPRGEKHIRMHRARSENGRSSRGQGSPRSTRLTREAKRSFDDDVVFDERFVIAEPLTYKNESTVTDKHLENLLIQEKANTLPTVDLSKLYEVKSAKGIPENESMEQRAARILGISVPAEALGVGEEEKEDPPHNSSGDTLAFSVENRSAHGGTKQVVEQCEEVQEPSRGDLEQQTVEGEEIGSAMEPTEHKSGGTPCEGRSSSSRGNSGGVDLQQMPALDFVGGNIPEFPPSKLTLSLHVIPIEKLPACGAEKRNRGAASKLIESLQDRLSSSASSSSAPSGRSATERMARLKELDSVSRIRRLSLKSSDSGGETEPEERDRDPEEEDGEKAELKGETTERWQDEEQGGQWKEEGLLVFQAGKAHETHKLRMDPKEVEKEVARNKEMQREEHSPELKIEGLRQEEHADVELHINTEEETLEEKTLKEHAKIEQEEHAEVELKMNIEEQTPEEKSLEEHPEVELKINIEEETLEEKSLEEHPEVELQTNVEEKRREEHAEVEFRINEGELKHKIALRADEEENDGVRSQNEEAAKAPGTAEEKEEPWGRESAVDGTQGEAGLRAVAGQAQQQQQVMRPKPRQRTSRPQKPPLLPKPRSVPKREITLPLSFSTVTSGLEDEEVLSVSASYDPSRVERV